MSRFKVQGIDAAYGFDPVPVPGYYYQEYDAEGEIVLELDTRREMLLSPRSRHASRAEIAAKMEEVGAPAAHVDAVVLDFPI